MTTSTLPGSTRGREILTGLTAIVLFFGGFLGAELGYRITTHREFGTAADVDRAKLYYRDEESGLRLATPSARQGRIRINANGFRGPPIDDPKPAGRLRLAFMGSSTTFDPYVDEDGMWPNLVTLRLRERAPACDVDYVNAALPGFSTENLIRYFDYRVAGVDPDIVLILTSDVNGDLDRYVEEAGLHSGVHYRKSWLSERSLLWAKIERNSVQISRQRAAFSEAGKVSIDAASLVTGFEARLTALVRRVEAGGALPVLITGSRFYRRDQDPAEQSIAAGTALFFIPYVSLATLLDVTDAYNAAVVRVAKAEGVPVITGENEIPATAEHFADSNHFAAKGSEAMAARVLRHLAASARVDDLLRREFPDCRLAASR